MLCSHIYACNDNTISFPPQNVTDEEDLAGDLKRVTFASTPVMSSYLLAFIVGEFDYVEEKDSNGVLVRVYTPLGKAEHGAFSLDVRLGGKHLPFTCHTSTVDSRECIGIM